MDPPQEEIALRVMPGDLNGVLAMPEQEPVKAAEPKQDLERSSPPTPHAPLSEEKTSPGETQTVPPRTEPQRQDSLKPEVNSAWAFFLDSAHEYDRSKIEKWTGELDNLLVFAGLFSAVVTAYTIESFSWLQEDSADTTNKILLQMSAQLASFSQSPGFMNSTAPAAPQNITSAAFQPESIDVTINMLWFLSLTLSLLAAFFAIAVQQWLRALPLPQHLPVIDSVQLWNYRTEHLILWQMPNIITLLPVALQISVVLFLVGLYHLLRSLNHPITAAYAVVAGVPFCMYAISIPLPLIWPHCPYKSPLLPSTVFLLRWCMALLLFLAIFLVFFPMLIVQVIVTYCISYVSSGGKTDPNLSLIGIERSMYWPTNTFGHLVSMALESDRDFWTKREVRRLIQKQDTDTTDNQGGALSRAPATIARNELDRLMPCLLSLPSLQRTRVLVNWMAFYFGVSRTEFSLYDGRSPLSLDILSRINRPFADAYTRFLLASLPDSWLARDWVYADEDVACLLILLTWVYKANFADPGLRRTWIPLLVDVCEGQNLSVIASSQDYENIRYPTVCLFESASQGLHAFSPHESERLVALAIKRIPELIETNERLDNEYLQHTVDMGLGTVAVALRALSHQDPPVVSAREDAVRQLLDAFTAFLGAQQQGIQYMAKLALEQPGQPLMITRRAMKGAVDALLVLAERRQLPADALASLVDALVQTCQGQRAFEDVPTVLDCLAKEAVVMFPVPEPAMPMPDVPERKEGTLSLDAISAIPLPESPTSPDLTSASCAEPLGRTDSPLQCGPSSITLHDCHSSTSLLGDHQVESPHPL
ncbi:hypothetical protein PsYK624_112110 [Phanerochaete sordida]|uniref:DUF6535 domain-containing protein n=1 Tax=Phanerochaete sordida TaxID=48140 RepID=A0A9P3GG65_9APHY|nr:hypothetical protein PsYK624_112110 [Phanerochaete sordida]